MRRTLFILFTLFATLSLLLCIACLVLWPLSYEYFTGAWLNVSDENSIGFETYQGSLALATGPAGGDEKAWKLGVYHDPIGAGNRIPVSDAAGTPGPGSLAAGPAIPFRVLPVPLWLAAIIAALAPGVWVWRFIVRRRRRRKQGECAACGYDLRGSAGAATCPECGAMVDGSIPLPPREGLGEGRAHGD